MAADCLPAKSLVEAFLYFYVTPCPICKVDRLEPGEPVPVDGQSAFDVVGVCRNCGGSESFRFAVPILPPVFERHDPVSSTQAINLGTDPSKLIDLVQWITLHETLLERSSSALDQGERRWLKIRAGQCLDEALKFFDDMAEAMLDRTELAESSKRALTEHPQRYTRSRLIDLRNQLPTDEAFAEAQSNDGPKRPWWKIW